MARFAIPWLWLALIVATASFPAWPQAHEREFGVYTLRSSTVSTTALPAQTVREHGITPDPNRAVLNVTLLRRRGDTEETVPAEVQAHLRNLTGQQRAVDMREVATGVYVSYMGVYDFTHGEVLDVSVSAQPAGGADTMTLSYRERMWAGGDLPDTSRHR